ncbi:MAG: hypothetical protein WBV82_12320 [Myxococcaceae bacterium]
MPSADALAFQARRQLSHWRHAVERLEDLDNFASPEAWAALEQYLGTTLRGRLLDGVKELKLRLRFLETLSQNPAPEASARLRAEVVAFRARFTRVETALDFYGDAVNTRSSPKLAALLRSCDLLATRAMQAVLVPLGKPVPPALSYVDRGLGAAILRANLRLWDGTTLSPVAAIKLTRHSLLRPTALLHEAGHQVAHLTGWNEALREALGRALQSDPELAEAWCGWASEIAADVFAFVHTGYAAVVALYDVVAGEVDAVFQQLPGDPHPLPALRVLLNIQLCQRWFGAGPWDEMSRAWRSAYPLRSIPASRRGFFVRSLHALPRIAEVCLLSPMPGFGGAPITRFVDPTRARPDRLLELERVAGPALYRSPHYLRTESIRLVALAGLKAALAPERTSEIVEQTEAWMTRLGSPAREAA